MRLSTIYILYIPRHIPYFNFHYLFLFCGTIYTMVRIPWSNSLSQYIYTLQRQSTSPATLEQCPENRRARLRQTINYYLALLIHIDSNFFVHFSFDMFDHRRLCRVKNMLAMYQISRICQKLKQTMYLALTIIADLGQV